MATILQAALPELHLPRSFPMTVRHGPVTALGLGIPDLWILQGIHKLWAYLKHGNSVSITGKLIRSSYKQATFEIGLPQLLTQSYRRVKYRIDIGIKPVSKTTTPLG